MTFTVNNLSRCAGQGHYTFSVTVGARTVTVATTRDEMQFDPGEDLDATREKVLDRIRSATKEAGAVTFQQARQAVEGKSFQI